MRLLFLVLALAACGGPPQSQALMNQYNMTVENGTQAERCAAARRVRDAFLQEGNRPDYLLWSVFAQSECQR